MKNNHKSSKECKDKYSDLNVQSLKTRKYNTSTERKRESKKLLKAISKISKETSKMPQKTSKRVKQISKIPKTTSKGIKKTSKIQPNVKVGEFQTQP